MKKTDTKEFDEAMKTDDKKVTVNGKALEVAKKQIETADKAIVSENTTKNIYQKLKGFRDDVESISKDGENPHFKSKYSTIESVLLTIDTPLSDNGLTFYQSVEGSNLITTIIDVDSEKSISSTIELLNKKGDMQGLGSAITYARRYGLVSMLGLIAEDDDANMASSSRSNTPPALITKVQFDEIASLVSVKGLDMTAIAQANNMSGLHELQAQNFQGFMSWLNAQ